MKPADSCHMTSLLTYYLTILPFFEVNLPSFDGCFEAYRRCRVSCCLPTSPTWRRREMDPLKSSYTLVKLHGVMSEQSHLKFYVSFRDSATSSSSNVRCNQTSPIQSRRPDAIKAARCNQSGPMQSKRPDTIKAARYNQSGPIQSNLSDTIKAVRYNQTCPIQSKQSDTIKAVRYNQTSPIQSNHESFITNFY